MSMQSTEICLFSPYLFTSTYRHNRLLQHKYLCFFEILNVELYLYIVYIPSRSSNHVNCVLSRIRSRLHSLKCAMFTCASSLTPLPCLHQRRTRQRKILTQKLGDPSLRRLRELGAARPPGEDVLPRDGGLRVHARGDGAGKARIPHGN